ncbi:hypothetical protein WG906_00945 [Pedobacter sp. P351]
MILVIGSYSYATWNGMTYWEDKAERNTQFNNHSRGHSGYVGRFYHK